MSSDSEADADGDGDGGLEFVVEQDVVIDGRLQVEAEDIGTHKLLNPWQAKRDSDLPAKALVSIDDIQKVSLPQYVFNHSHHPLGAQALIEAVLLCHQGCILSTTATYDLTDIWIGLLNDSIFVTDANSDSKIETSNDVQILPHTLDAKLLEMLAKLDRRLDSALMILAIKQLSQHDLSQNTINE
ncbi:MAG: peptidase M48, partial [Psychrobacter sp.]|nr:peptidase M48 [Psychrobacter sp.]